jgi:hypothetical protein
MKTPVSFVSMLILLLVIKCNSIKLMKKYNNGVRYATLVSCGGMPSL